MRSSRVRFTLRRMMIAVAVVSVLLPPAIYLWRIWQNWRAYSAGASSHPYFAISDPYPETDRRSLLISSDRRS